MNKMTFEELKTGGPALQKRFMKILMEKPQSIFSLANELDMTPPTLSRFINKPELTDWIRLSKIEAWVLQREHNEEQD